MTSYIMDDILKRYVFWKILSKGPHTLFLEEAGERWRKHGCALGLGLGQTEIRFGSNCFRAVVVDRFLFLFNFGFSSIKNCFVCLNFIMTRLGTFCIYPKVNLNKRKCKPQTAISIPKNRIELYI